MQDMVLGMYGLKKADLTQSTDDMIGNIKDSINLRERKDWASKTDEWFQTFLL